ncbi:hypothetical protein MRX96_058286 [Rhipicephalus microplus]
MEEIVAKVGNVVFELEVALEQQLGALPLPFPGMDKSGAAVCCFYVQGNCSKASACPFRHVKGDRTVVCKHWLRGLCKKGDQCEFLHEFDMTKMPECYFYSRFNACSNKECPFLHIDPEAKIKDCPWYDPRLLSTRPSLSPPAHPARHDPAQQAKKANIVCHYCGEAGHKAISCHKMPPEVREEQQHSRMQFHNHYGGMHRRDHDDSGGPSPGGQRGFRPLDQVTCYKCGEKGHYANKCPKGHLAFLSSALQNTPSV